MPGQDLGWGAFFPSKITTLRRAGIAIDGARDLADVWGCRKRLPKERAMPTGTVKWFNSVKGYGFIQPSDGSKDAFVHISAVEKAGMQSLREGQKVQYELVPGRDGRASAENLVALD